MAFQQGGASTPLAFLLIVLFAGISIGNPHGVLASTTTRRARLLADAPAFPTRATSTNDKTALLLMAKSLSDDARSLGSWQDRTDPCSDVWAGVSCDVQGNVIGLNLSNLNLKGSIPSQLGSLANLRHLSLARNSLLGGIPGELGQLRQLESLNLSRNALTGTVAFVASLPLLSVLDLSHNSFTGPIPPDFATLPNLRELLLSNNSLTGPVPNQLRKLVGIQRLLLDFNPLSGEAPTWLPELRALREIALGPSLDLYGSISANISALAALQSLRVAGTNVGGGIPSQLGGLHNLEVLDLRHNLLNGVIPTELSLLSNLSYLDLSGNRLSGLIPPDIGDLVNLKTLDLSNNSFVGPIPTSFGNLKRLRILRLQHNSLNGTIPAELGTLNVAEQTLMRLNLEHNNLTGEIPGELAALEDLRGLVLRGNQLSGYLPSEFFLPHTLIRLKKFDVAWNLLTGSVPLNLVSPVGPAVWMLEGNYFSDIAQTSMQINVTRDGNCVGVQLPKCGAPGQKTVFECSRYNTAARECLCHLPSVVQEQEFDLPPHNVTCAIPIQVSMMFFSEHRRAERLFALALPNTLGQLALQLSIFPRQITLHNSTTINRQTILMVVNILPPAGPTFSDKERKRLKDMFDVDNPLPITIPSFTPGYSLISLVDFSPNMSANTPALPPSPQSTNNSSPTGSQAPTTSQVAPSPSSRSDSLGSKSKNSGSLSAGAIVGVIIACIIVALILAIALLQCVKTQPCYAPPGSDEFDAVLHPMVKRFTYMEMLEATDYFSDNNRMGESPSGNIFRAMLSNRKPVAVKRLEISSEQDERSFLNEIRVIGSIHHRNCLQLYGFCLEDENRCLVFDLMPNGSLQAALFNRNYPTSLSWAQYAKILRDVASGIRYLHHDCDYKVIHRDLSPENILLDQDFTGVVADFGTPKDFSAMSSQMDWSGAGTGYMAPEFLRTGKLSEKCDVYSFGVVMLVVISGSPPHSSQHSAEDNLVKRAFDAARSGQSLRLLNTRFFNHCSPSEARRFINVALLCVLPDPAERPAMTEVVEMITGRLPIPPIIIPNEMPDYEGGVSRSQLSLGNNITRSMSQSSTPSFRFN